MAAAAEAAPAAVVEAEAEYHDGRQARPLWLRARLTPASLELRRAGGEAVASWPVAALRVVDRAGGALRLAPDGSDARLLVSDAALVAALEAAQRPRRRAALRRRLRMAALAAVLVPAGGLALWKGWPPAADAIARAVPADWERSIGAATAAAFIGGKRVCDAPAGQAALDALAAKLAAAGGVPAAGLRVRVLDDPAVNALAAPGGEVIVFRGLLDRAGSAEELAGVLAHELAHVKHRHGLRGVARVAGLFVLTGALTGGSDAVAAAAVLVGLSYSREFEREADADGARMLRATGIGAEGLQAFFARLERDGPGASGSLWDYVSTHPADADRIAALRAEARPADPAQAMPAGEWAAVRAICGAARKGEPKAGSAKSQPAAGRAARPRTRSLGTFADWEAWTYEERGRGTMCYAVAYPVPAPGERRSRKTMLWLAHRPWNRMNDISFETDVEPPPAGAAIRIEFGGRAAALRMRRGAAWPHDTEALSAALRAAAAEGVAEATVSWSEAVKEYGEAPRRTHRFGLRGLVEAHAAIGEACQEAHAPAAPATTAAAASAP
ncbi:hypothetical protein GCM10009416_20590 [Craurococcus roseus]|uniref:Peptidase M48 domain-containing protein n=1 Tax=Craurococcus roseus TaxID=77585 RepID=A0ABP3Q7G2_9PROT